MRMAKIVLHWDRMPTARSEGRWLTRQSDQMRRAAPAVGAAESGNWDRGAGCLQQAIEQVALVPAGHGAKVHDAPGRGQPVDVPA